MIPILASAKGTNWFLKKAYEGMAGLLFSLILSIIIDAAGGENKRTIRDCLVIPHPLSLSPSLRGEGSGFGGGQSSLKNLQLGFFKSV
jgi:hypothetical protein